MNENLLSINKTKYRYFMDNIDFVKVGERIAARRREMNLKQWQVEQKAGIGDHYLSNIEHGKTVISIDVLMKLCNALNTTPDAFLLDEMVDEDNDYVKSINSRLRQMSSKQARLALSLMDWILTQKIE